MVLCVKLMQTKYLDLYPAVCVLSEKRQQYTIVMLLLCYLSWNLLRTYLLGIIPTDLLFILDSVPSIRVVLVSNHVATDKLTTANGGTFTSSSATDNQSQYPIMLKHITSPIERRELAEILLVD